MLILVLFYLMYLIAWRIYEDKEKVLKITTIITIFGIINIPIIKYSVDWWNTLHQPASINLLSKSSIHSSMLFPLMIMNNDKTYLGALEVIENILFGSKYLNINNYYLIFIIRFLL